MTCATNMTMQYTLHCLFLTEPVFESGYQTYRTKVHEKYSSPQTEESIRQLLLSWLTILHNDKDILCSGTCHLLYYL